MKLYYFLFLLILGLATQIHCYAEENDPRKTAESFYTQLCSAPVSGLPKGKAWSNLKPYLTPKLINCFQEARRAQENFMKKNPGEKPPWIEGDLFSSLFEGPQKFTTGSSIIKDNHAEVPMHLSSKQGDTVTRWTDTLLLRQVNGRWLIEDICYGGNWAFAPKGLLSEMLKDDDHSASK